MILFFGDVTAFNAFVLGLIGNELTTTSCNRQNGVYATKFEIILPGKVFNELARPPKSKAKAL